MFWVDRKAEPNNKFKFYAIFSVFGYDPITQPNNAYRSSLTERGEFNFVFTVKKIDAPKLNLEFERAYANEYVHYFQNGPIHWEPINITFADMVPLKQDKETPNIRKFFFNYLNDLAYKNTTGNQLNFSDNRTNLIDLPNLCQTIQIVNETRFANDNYIKGKDLFGLNQDDRVVNNAAGSIEQKVISTSTNKQNIFVIHKPKLTKVDFGSFDYSSDDVNEISITIVPEWCSYADSTTNPTPNP